MERIIAGMEAELANLPHSDPTRSFIEGQKDIFVLEAGKDKVHKIRGAVSQAFPLSSNQRDPRIQMYRDALVLHAQVLLIKEMMGISFPAIGKEFGIAPFDALNTAARAKRMYGVNPDFAATIDSVKAHVDPAEENNEIVPYPQEKLRVDPASRGLGYLVNFLSRELRVELEDLKSSSRVQDLVRDRATIASIARELTPASYAQIGGQLGGRDHSTIIHLVQKAQELMEKDSRYAKSHADLKRKASQPEGASF